MAIMHTGYPCKVIDKGKAAGKIIALKSEPHTCFVNLLRISFFTVLLA